MTEIISKNFHWKPNSIKIIAFLEKMFHGVFEVSRLLSLCNFFLLINWKNGIKFQPISLERNHQILLSCILETCGMQTNLWETK